MSKKFAITTLLLLSVGVMAQQAGQQPVYPKGSSPRSQQPAKDGTTQTTQAFAPDAHDRLLEGCVAGTRDNLILTDATGKVYQLRGETAKLAEHIGQQASVTGTDAPRDGSGAVETQLTFVVKKVAMIASVCSASK